MFDTMMKEKLLGFAYIEIKDVDSRVIYKNMNLKEKIVSRTMDLLVIVKE